MRLLPLASLPLVVAIACATPPLPEPVAPRVSAVHDLAGRARYHVISAAELSDSAAVQAQFASADDAVIDARILVRGAAEVTRIAGADLKLALDAGNRLEIFVDEEERKAGRRGFAHYWQLGRAKLDSARAQQQQALLAADSALEMRDHLIMASGATREAESIVRIAVMYLRGY